MRKRRNFNRSIQDVVLIAGSLLGVLALVSIFLGNNNTTSNPDVWENITTPSTVSNEVKEYRPLVESYAQQFGVSDYTNVILAIMMQESSGQGGDPMQASESYCGEVGCIDNPELSIKQGVDYFSQTLEAADGDLALAVQSYNFGKGFINYVEDQNSSYSQEMAIDFSQEMYQETTDQANYTCLREGAEQYNACYGDIYYVPSVMSYHDTIQVESSS